MNSINLEEIKIYLDHIGVPSKVISNINDNEFSEVFVKRISDSNVMDANKKERKENGGTNNQTHLDVTGPSTKFFISTADKAAHKMGGTINKDIYIKLIANNISHLELNDNIIDGEILPNGRTTRMRKSYIPVYSGKFEYQTSTVQAKIGHGDSPQVQINSPEDNPFKKLRKLIYKNDALIFLKYKNCEDEYLVIAIPNEEIEQLDEDSLLRKPANNVYRLDESEIKEGQNKSYTINYQGNTVETSVKMTEVPYLIVKHYIDNHTDLNFTQLEDKFKDCRCGKRNLLLKLTDKSSVRESDYFRPAVRPNLIVNNTEFGVCTQWHGTGKRENFNSFIEKVKNLGYEVELQNIQPMEKFIGKNIMISGAPGTGKSHYVNKIYGDKNQKRVMFHSEYTYNDFVGCIRPVRDIDGKLTYDFVPGVFTEILYEALNDKNNMYYLIIEELNRANPDEVFGDIFQLLDRDDEGVSEYPVNNTDIFTYLCDNLESNYDFIYGWGKVYIPNNLTIIATLNSSDQKSNIMDTAFKRRWNHIYMDVEFKSDHKFKDICIPNLELTWEQFAVKVNEFMLNEDNEHLMIMEDKQLGPYFIKEESLLDAESFAYKVLLYLWDDVFKGDRYKLFNSQYRAFSHVVRVFSTQNAIDVFSAEFIKFITSNNSSTVVKDDE